MTARAPHRDRNNRLAQNPTPIAMSKLMKGRVAICRLKDFADRSPWATNVS